jgi:hypothetical protein
MLMATRWLLYMHAMCWGVCINKTGVLLCTAHGLRRVASYIGPAALLMSC